MAKAVGVRLPPSTDKNYSAFARLYNARAKVIERFFKEFQEGVEKLFQSYVESCIQNKSAYLQISFGKLKEKF